MKRKNLIILITIIVFVIIVFLLIFFSKNVYNLYLVKNLKNILTNQISESNNVTIIDVTSLLQGDYIEHDHIFKSQYDTDNHWEECTICHSKQNLVKHSFTTTWALAGVQCQKDNSYTNTCKCGYSYVGHKSCVWNGSSYAGTIYINGYCHNKICSVCKDAIRYSYYMGSYGNGNVHYVNQENTEVPNWPELESCYLASGSKIDCNNLGTCRTCKINRTPAHYRLTADFDTGKIYCMSCKKDFGTFSHTINKSSTSPTTYTIIQNITLINGATFNSTGKMREPGNPWQTNTQTISNKNSAGTQFTLTTTAKFKNTTKEKYNTFFIFSINIGGSNCYIFSNEFYTYPDLISPSISSVTVGDSSSGSDWAKSKSIKISGTENYCSTVNIEIFDDKNRSVYTGVANVTNNNYSILCTPELEANNSGKVFKVIVTDACDNKTEKSFSVSKIDGVAPVITSQDRINGNWSKEKNFTFTATDSGIGNISIAFNRTSDYSLAEFKNNLYSKSYKFVGDVYSSKTATLYCKDGLNNLSIQRVTIDKIDNTAPTILSANIHNNKLLVQSNDIKEGLGEGSGVKKYRYITSDKKLDNPNISSGIEVDVKNEIIIDGIYNIKYVYVVAEDLVRKCK